MFKVLVIVEEDEEAVRR